MDIKLALTQFLLGKVALTGLISQKLYPDIAPQATALPYVVYDQDSSDHEHYLGGSSNMPTAFFVLTIFASSNASRTAIKEALRNIIDGRLTTLMSDGISTIDVREMWLLSPTDSYDAPRDARELGVFVCQVVLKMTYFETAPTLP